MDDGPEFQTVLEPGGGQNLANKFGSELVFGTTPQCGQAELGVRIEGWFLENALFGMEELTNEMVVESGLPPEGWVDFDAVICSACRLPTAAW